MKTLNTHSSEAGRMPLWTKDFDFLQDSYKEVLIALIKDFGLGKSNFIISGCKITHSGSLLDMEAGWAYFCGEILPVHALHTTTNLADPIIYFTKIDYINPEGLRNYVMSDNSTVARNTYSDPYLNPQVADNQSTYYLGIKEGFCTLAERLRKGISLMESEWTAASSAGYNIYYKQVGKMVFLKGYAYSQVSLNAVYVADQLPRPAVSGEFYPFVGINNDEDGVELPTSVQLVDDGIHGKIWAEGTNLTLLRVGHIMYLAAEPYRESDSTTLQNTIGGSQGGNES